MSLSDAQSFECPYCMAINDLEVDPINDVDQSQVVDCQVCCQPIVIRVTDDGHEYYVDARAENE
ncbi:CPXCG motif-containing cysteine-rich protein [Saliniradius amylolyticus]|uniref:CPXCG motif-containing cysteine-rich protein n=1 Tax=Saliniradius amylolyticus TaxID=2183582 RepID=UPI000D6895A2|nr:CPXCG motif-containing cysteine-rich protein [Saliniradius amylolyticus]